MTATASSGSPRVTPQSYDTLPLSSVRQAEQQDRFPDGGELSTLATFFRSGTERIEASRLLAINAEGLVAKAANRVFVGGTPLSFLESPLTTGEELKQESSTPLAADQEAFASSVRTFTSAEASVAREGNFFTRLFKVGSDTDVRVILPAGFIPISISKYGPARMRKSVRDLGWFLRYVGYALVAGDPSILSVNARGLRDILEKGCSLIATNVALQEMRAGAAALFRDRPEARRLVIDCFNVLLRELAVATPSARQKPGSPVRQGLQLPAIYALASEPAQRFEMRPGLSGAEKKEIVRAAYRQVFERDIAKGYSQFPCASESSQLLQGKISMREFIRALGQSKEYRQQFYGRFVNSRVVELAYRHFLGRGISSLEEFRSSFAAVSKQGLSGLIDTLLNSDEYARTFGEETVPYLRDIGEEAQESAGWGSNRRLFRFSAPFEGAPQYITLYAAYQRPLADQHVYGGGNDPIGNQYGAIFPSSTASVTTRSAPFGYDTRRLLVGNGMAQPGQMGSVQFRESQPRRGGPRIVRLQRGANSGALNPQRGSQAQPSIVTTESSSQAVINAVYTQVLGFSGYAGERLASAENRLENGNINLREFIRQVARSKAFRRRYWEGLYVTKAIEVMHRRLLGRPTFGRWEIDALFDTAARQGFYGIVDALIGSREFGDCFGDDTVPYERFITPGDVTMRRVPSLRRPINPTATAVVDLSLRPRPDAQPSKRLRITADLTPRNLSTTKGSSSQAWTPLVSNRSATKSLTKRTLRDLSSDRIFSTAALPEDPEARLRKALAPGTASGYRRTSRLSSTTVEFRGLTSEYELQGVITSVYRQLLNRVPFGAERLSSAESQLRNGQVSLDDFVGLVALSDIFQERIAMMAPLRAATAVAMALLGRAGTPAEVRRFLITRATSGQPAAVRELLLQRIASEIPLSEVLSLDSLASKLGVPQATITRTASLYGGNAGLTPTPNSAL
ncbi:anchor polypeptide LCM [cyanobiont of Ornithocercus magnificus]|nr:anchor polypeptide LCM [cyanobiont of Ornithocercus magnificus]